MSLRRLRGKRRPADEGLTLIEVVVAALLVAVLASVVLRVILQTQSVEVDNRARVSAASLASREISMVTEEFYASDDAPAQIEAQGVVTNPHPLDGGVAGDPLVLEGTAYTVTRSAAWNITGTGQSPCDGGSIVQYPVLEITAVVTWDNMGSTKPVVASTVLSPDKVAGISTTDAFVAVKVVDSEGADSVGRHVTVASGGTSYPGQTDSDGCAVVRVSPGTTGADYTVTLGDTGYVDLSGNNTPSKVTGTVHQGDLNTAASFAYDLGGTIAIQLVDGDGNAMSGALGSSAQVTLVASEYSGASGASSQTVTDGLTTLAGLFWPTTYGAYLGSTAPASYETEALTAGSSITLEVTLAKATVQVTGAPSGAEVVAVPSGSGDCTAADAVGPFAQDSAEEMLPGTWDFFVVQDSGAEAFACSPGPTAIELAPDEDREITWELAEVTVPDAPTTGTLYALDRDMVSTALTTCPSGSDAGHAWEIDAARTGTVELPAGDWYFYVDDGSGTCEWAPTIAPYSIAYGAGTVTVPWPAAGTFNVTNTRANRYIIVATAPVQSCTTTAYRLQGSSTWQNDVFGSPSPTTSDYTTVTGSLAAGTYYYYGWGVGTSSCWYKGSFTISDGQTLNLSY